MKALFLVLLTFFTSNCFATFWITFPVYTQTTYLQGSWSRLDMLGNSNYEYLQIHEFEDLMGSGDGILIESIFLRLKELKPDAYTWNYKYSISNDSITITALKEVMNPEIANNEIALSFLMNSFSYVSIVLNDRERAFTIDSISLPYLDLVTSKKETKVEDTISIEKEKQDSDIQIKTIHKTSYPFWIYISILLNVGLIAAFIFFRKK